MSGDEKVIPLRRRAREAQLPLPLEGNPPSGETPADAQGEPPHDRAVTDPDAPDADSEHAVHLPSDEDASAEVHHLHPAGHPGDPAEDDASDGDGPRPPPPALLVPAVEACLFAMGGVVTLTQLCAALHCDETAVRAALTALDARLTRTGAGVRLVAVADGWQLRTDARFAAWVATIRGGKPFRLSKPALEVLSVVAFRQPVSKGGIDDIRGVDSGGVLRMLLERGLVRILGRSEDPGRPLTYGTTPAFLELFGMRSLADLPTLKDLRQLQPEDTGDEGE